MNKVVVRYADGRMLKGTAADFFPGKDLFHVCPVGDPEGVGPVEVHAAELKAVFFVKDFAGNPEYSEHLEADAPAPRAWAPNQGGVQRRGSRGGNDDGLSAHPSRLLR